MNIPSTFLECSVLNTSGLTVALPMEAFDNICSTMTKRLRSQDLLLLVTRLRPFPVSVLMGILSSLYYSYRKLLTGLIFADFKVFMLTVKAVSITRINTGNRNNEISIGI